MKNKRKNKEELKKNWELPLAFNVYNTFMADNGSFDDCLNRGGKLAKKC